MALPGSAAPPAPDSRRDAFAVASGEAVVNLLRKGITARQIMTKEAFENAITVVMALGGSTNAVLHLMAIAHEAQVDLDARGLQPDRRPHPAPGRREAVRPVRDDRRRPHRRRPGRPAGAAGRRPAARRRAHRDREDDGREPGRDRPAGPRRRDHPRDERPDPQDRRALDPARLAGPGGRGREVGRLRRRDLRGHRPRLRRRAGRDGRRHRGHAASPATSSSSATRARAAGPACARCSPSPARSRAPASARTSCCSPTAASPAARRACASATSPPRRPTAARSPSSATATAIRLDLAARTLDLLVDEAELAAPPRGLGAAAAALHDRGARQVREARRLGRPGRHLRLSRPHPFGDTPRTGDGPGPPACHAR